MSRIVKRIGARVERVEVEGLLCPNCGTKDFTETSRSAIPCHTKHCGSVMARHTFRFSSTRPGYVVLECDCGATVTCDEAANACPCGATYGRDGTPLALPIDRTFLNVDDDTSVDDEDATHVDSGAWAEEERRPYDDDARTSADPESRFELEAGSRA